MASIKPSPSQLYDHDYYAWIRDQVRALRDRRIEDVDWENVAEEIEDLGKSERRGIESQMARLVEHLLKLQYARATLLDYSARGWQLSVKGARIAIQKLLRESPSLRSRLAEMLVDAYEIGRIEALREATLPDDAVPESPPWAVELVMDPSFLP